MTLGFAGYPGNEIGITKLAVEAILLRPPRKDPQMSPHATCATVRRPVLRTAAAFLLLAVALTGAPRLSARAETGAMTAAPEMSCAEFSAMVSTDQMQAMATMAASEMAADDATSGAMAADVPATGAMADHDDLMAMIDACAGHENMMAADAMHAAVTN